MATFGIVGALFHRALGEPTIHQITTTATTSAMIHQWSVLRRRFFGSGASSIIQKSKRFFSVKIFSRPLKAIRCGQHRNRRIRNWKPRMNTNRHQSGEGRAASRSLLLSPPGTLPTGASNASISGRLATGGEGYSRCLATLERARPSLSRLGPFTGFFLGNSVYKQFYRIL
jgi:hypothetical protein